MLSFVNQDSDFKLERKQENNIHTKMLVDFTNLNGEIQSSHRFGNCGYDCDTESDMKSNVISLSKLSLCALPVAPAVKLVIKHQ